MNTILLGAIIGAIGFRARGAAWSSRILGGSGIAARGAFWSIPMGIVAALEGGPWWHSILVGIGAFIAASIGTMDAIDAGRREGTRAGDFGWNLMRGLLMGTVLAVASLISADPEFWVPLAAGIFVPLAYELAWRVRGEKDATAWAEVAVGALLGAGVGA